MKYFIVVGERSGDLHGANLITQIKLLDPKGEVYAWGGQQMSDAGATILEDYKSINFIGLSEVLSNLLHVNKKLKLCKKQIEQLKPDCLVLIDSPGFNLRIAAYARQLGIKTTYYISPKIWAWNKSRIKKIKESVDQMMVILPFEKQFYRQESMDVEYVGNPILDALNNYEPDQAFLSKYNPQKTIAVLPGSRTSEVRNAVKVIQELVVVFEEIKFLVAAVDNVNERLYKPLLSHDNVEIINGKTYDVLNASSAAVVTSGTATLEAALLGTPQVVVYKTSLLTYIAAKLLLKVPYISLVNLIAGHRVVTELIQGDYDSANVVAELESLLTDEGTKKRISEGYSEIRKVLGDKSASKNAAEIIYKLCSS